MMPPETLPPTEPSTPAKISRRKLLKMITVAGAGASAAVLLSGQWVKPVAAGGKLAPHAQTSQPQPTLHQFVQGSGTAQQNPADDADADLLTSAKITPPDPNIPIVATVTAIPVIPTGSTAPIAPIEVGAQTVNTNATGTAVFTFSNLPLDCQNAGFGAMITVVFTFASLADGTGSLIATTPWTFGC
jgi:hypothetical protein